MDQIKRPTISRDKVLQDTEAERDLLAVALRGLLALTEGLAKDYGDELWLSRKTRYRKARAAIDSLGEY